MRVIGPEREQVITALTELNELIDSPLIERGFDQGAEVADLGEPAEVAYVLTRTMKLAEELGELITAITGRMALNFRKGRTEHSWLDVSDELNDIATTAVLANKALFGLTDPIAELELHILGLARRAREAEEAANAR
jgi:hypothetical protein